MNFPTSGKKEHQAPASGGASPPRPLRRPPCPFGSWAIRTLLWGLEGQVGEVALQYRDQASARWDGTGWACVLGKVTKGFCPGVGRLWEPKEGEQSSPVPSVVQSLRVGDTMVPPSWCPSLPETQGVTGTRLCLWLCWRAAFPTLEQGLPGGGVPAPPPTSLRHRQDGGPHLTD